MTLVFDGPVPRGGLSKQMSSSRITVRFAAPATADDVIVEMIHQVRHPSSLRVVTGDSAIRHEARLRRCRHVDAVAFVREMFAPPRGSKRAEPATPEKPTEISPEETKTWLDVFGIDEAEPVDGQDAVNH